MILILASVSIAPKVNDIRQAIAEAGHDESPTQLRSQAEYSAANQTSEVRSLFWHVV